MSVPTRLTEETRKLLKRIGVETGETLQDVALRLARAEWERVKVDVISESHVGHRRNEPEIVRENGVPKLRVKVKA